MSGGPAAGDRPLSGAPDVAGYAVGWRAWSVSARGTVLKSPTGGEIWPAGSPMVAKCRIYREHTAPVPGCMCGLYGVADPVSTYLAGQRAVLGCAALWGTLVEGERGWRASHGYPLLLLATPRVSRAARDRLAAAYRVPVYEFPVRQAVYSAYSASAQVRARLDALRERAAVPGESFDDLIEELHALLDPGPGTEPVPRKTLAVKGKPPRRAPAPVTAPGGTGERTVAGFISAAVVAVAAAVGIFVYANAMGDPVFSARITDNAAPGSCLPSGQNWAYQSVTPDTCDSPHWGEVLGYPTLGPTPSPYPGDAVVDQRAAFACGRLLAEQGWSPAQYATTSMAADPASWNTGHSDYQNYATCVVYRRDKAPMPPGHAPHGPRRTAVTVPMSLYDTSLSTNAPAGSCVATKDGVTAPSGKVPVVDCKQPHWATVLGYPALYRPGTRWPGDDAAYAAAQSACRRYPLAQGQVSDVIWPAKDWWANPKQPIYATCLSVPEH